MNAKKLQSEFTALLETLTPEPIWDAALPLLSAHLRAELATCYAVVRSVELWHWSGPFGDRFLSAVKSGLAAGRSDMFAYDPLNPGPAIRNRALTLQEIVRANGGRGAAAERLKEDAYYGKDQLGAIVCDENRLLACIAVARPEPFGAQEKSRLEQLVPLLQRRLKLDLHLRQGPVLRAGLNASLDLIPSQACIVRATTGQLDLVEANQLAQLALAQDRPRLLAELQDSLLRPSEAAAFRVTRLEGSGVANHFLLVRAAPPQPSLAPRLEVAEQRWELTRKQSAVLQRLVLGHSNKEIGHQLRRAEGAVEHHVTALLRKSGAGSRAELIALFWSALRRESRRLRPGGLRPGASGPRLARRQGNEATLETWKQTLFTVVVQLS